MVQREHGKDVDLEVLQDPRPRDVLHQWVGFDDAGVWDDNVKMGDAMLRLEAVDEFGCVFFARGVALCDDQTAALALG